MTDQDYLRGYNEGYMAALRFQAESVGIRSLDPMLQLTMEGLATPSVPEPPKKRKTKYQAAYKRNFNKVKSKYLKQNGQWKQGGFKRAVKEAHRLTRK